MNQSSLAVAALTCWVCWSITIPPGAASVFACTFASSVIPISVWTNAVVPTVLQWFPHPPVEPMGICPNVEGHFVAAACSSWRSDPVPSSPKPRIYWPEVKEVISNFNPNKGRAMYIHPETFLWTVKDRPVQMYCIPMPSEMQCFFFCSFGRRFFSCSFKVSQTSFLK